MDDVNSVVLESAVALLSGGSDQKGNPLVVFPTDSADLIDVYSYSDILPLLRAYADIAGDKVAIVADLKHGWTEECITKLTSLLDALQVRRVESFEELYNYIDRSQLTLDYGGTLQYNHVAWVDFQKTYSPIVTSAQELVGMLPDINEEVTTLKQRDVERFTSVSVKCKAIKAKYETVLGNHRVRDIMSTCKDALDRLDNPEDDSNLIQIHATLLVDTVGKVRNLLHEITEEVDSLDTLMTKTENEQALFGKLQECQQNAQEVLETIDRMKQRIAGLPLVGGNVSEAQRYRAKFTNTVIEPSKDIVACATAILTELDTGKNTTPKSYTMAFEIAKKLTEALQPFTRDLNQLNETYTRIHLFFVIFNKTNRWKVKATSLIMKHLLPITECADSRTQATDKIKYRTNSSKRITFANDVDHPRESEDTSIGIVCDSVKESRLIANEKRKTSTCSKTKSDCEHNRRPVMTDKFKAHSNWSDALDQFYYKHPAPRKKHLRLITKFAPNCISQGLKKDAKTLAERTLFILAFLERDQFKAEDIYVIREWSVLPRDLSSGSTAHFAEVSLV